MRRVSANGPHTAGTAFAASSQKYGMGVCAVEIFLLQMHYSGRSLTCQGKRPAASSAGSTEIL